MGTLYNLFFNPWKAQTPLSTNKTDINNKLDHLKYQFDRLRKSDPGSNLVFK